MTQKTEPGDILAVRVRFFWFGFLFAMGLSLLTYFIYIDTERQHLRAYKRFVQKCLPRSIFEEGVFEQDSEGNITCRKRIRKAGT